MVGLVSRRVNLSVDPLCAIQKPLRINTQLQLQSSESHHALGSPTQAVTIYQTLTSKLMSFS